MTQDSGQHWEQVDSEIPTWTPWQLYFVNGTTGWAVDVGRTVVKTTDGGITWTVQWTIRAS